MSTAWSRSTTLPTTRLELLVLVPAPQQLLLHLVRLPGDGGDDSCDVQRRDGVGQLAGLHDDNVSAAGVLDRERRCDTVKKLLNCVTLAGGGLIVQESRPGVFDDADHVEDLPLSLLVTCELAQRWDQLQCLVVQLPDRRIGQTVGRRRRCGALIRGARW